jgi:DNA polymerase/3'-5' exonuclease PolX
MSEKQSRLPRKNITRRRRFQKGGIGLTLPFFQYIPLDTNIRNFERVLCAIQSIDIHTDLLTFCGLDTKDQVWFGFQCMDFPFYETYMNRIGYENPDTLILRNYTLDGFSQQDTKIHQIKDTEITVSMIHDIWSMKLQSDFRVPWKIIYHGKELYQMMTTQLLDSSVSNISNNTKPLPKSSTNSLSKMIFPDFQQRRQKLNASNKRQRMLSSMEEDNLENVHGIGEKTIEMLREKNIYTIKNLRTAIQVIPTLLNRAQTIGLQYYEDLIQPILREETEKYESRLQEIMRKIEPVMKMTIAGSYRRNRRTSHDIDVLFTHPQNPELDRETWLDTFVAALVEENIKVVYLTRTSSKRLAIIKMKNMKFHRRIDFMVVPYSTYPFALLYLTGSKEFTVKMRQQAISKGYSLSENGFKDLKTNERVNVHDFKSEKDVFDFLEMDYLAPEDRI